MAVSPIGRRLVERPVAVRPDPRSVGVAERLVVNRSPQAELNRLIELKDHNLNLIVLVSLRQLSDHERRLEELADKPARSQKYVRTAQLSPGLQAALRKGYALEAETEFSLQLMRAFPEEIGYVQHYIELCLLAQDTASAGEALEKYPAEERRGAHYFALLDRHRELRVEEFLKEHPGEKPRFNKLLSQLKSKGVTSAELGDLLDSEIRFECFTYLLFKLREEQRGAAFRAADRLHQVVSDVRKHRLQELKFGIFGRILNDAVCGEKLSAEEAELLKEKALLGAYGEHNPQRMAAFLTTIEDILKSARRGEKTANLELLKVVYQQAVLEAESTAEEGPLVIKKDDGTDFAVATEDDCLSAGWSLISWGRVEEALEFGRRYSRSRPGVSGYAVEVLALTELERYEEAGRQLVEVELLLDKELSIKLRQAIVRRESYFLIETEDELKSLVCPLKTIRFQGRKTVLRGFEQKKMNGLLYLADRFPKYRAQIFDKLAVFFARQAVSLEGLPAAVGFVYGLLKELEEKNPIFAPLEYEFERILPAVHGPIMDFLRGNRETAVEVGTNFLSPYAKVLANTDHFLEAAEIFEIFLPEEKEGETLDLLGINTLVLCAINYGNAGREEKAVELHLRLARFFEGARGEQARQTIAAAHKVTDYAAKNYALLANLHTDPAEVEHFVELALRAGPRSETALTNITTALVFLKRYDEAESYARSTLLLNPLQGSANFDLAKVLMETSREREVWEIVTLFEMKDRDAVPRIAWLNCIMFRMSTEFGYTGYGELLARNRAAYPKEKMAEAVRTYPGMFRRRLSLAFLDYLGV